MIEAVIHSRPRCLPAHLGEQRQPCESCSVSQTLSNPSLQWLLRVLINHWAKITRGDEQPGTATGGSVEEWRRLTLWTNLSLESSSVISQLCKLRLVPELQSLSFLIYETVTINNNNVMVNFKSRHNWSGTLGTELGTQRTSSNQQALLIFIMCTVDFSVTTRMVAEGNMGG